MFDQTPPPEKPISIENPPTDRLLRSSTSLFRSIFVSSPLGIKVLDREGKIIRANPAMQAILGYSSRELSGKRFSLFTHPADLDRSEKCFNSLVLGNTQNYRLDKRYITKSGSIVWANLVFSAVRDENGKLQFVVGMIENITQRKEMEAELAEMKNIMLDSTERERLRLAQELHDGPMQDLHSIDYQIKGLISGAGENYAPVLEAISHTVHNVLQALRATATQLRPPVITDFGLAKAMRSHVDGLQERHPEISIHLDLAEDRTMLPQRVRLALFRIFQQAVMNSILHAQTDEIRVRFALEPEDVILEIVDDGVGFEVPSRWIGLVRKGHFGLAGAAERVEALGGKFIVESKPGAGTTLRAIVPRPAKDETSPG